MLIEILKTVLGALRSVFQSSAALLAENVVMRQQIIVLRRSVPKPRIRARDRVVLALAARVCGSVLQAISIVRPETVVRWHRSFGRLIWRKRSKRPVGRPPANADLRTMIRRYWKENPLWGEDRIAGELCKLGYKVSPRTVAKYRPPHLPRNRGQSWPTFIRNHLHQTWACDFLTIVTLRFQILYCFVIVDLARREIVHIGVTSSPSAQYAGQCFVEAVADRDNENPRFMIRDRDSIYGAKFRRRVKSCGTRCLITPPRSPKANAICERLNGTLRRDCLDHIIVIDDVHADRVLREYVRYYHGRPHRGLCMQPPLGARWLPPCDVLHPRTSSLDLSSLAFTTNTTRGPPETDRRGADRERRGAGPSHVPPTNPRSRVRRAPSPIGIIAANSRLLWG
ncbi:MAG: integrase core domain-containing protein [Polyangia bacterium]